MFDQLKTFSYKRKPPPHKPLLARRRSSNPDPVKRRFHPTGLILLALLLLAGTPMRAFDADDITPIGLAEFSRLDRLPRLRTVVKTASISSYDRTGGNDDGFSGKYSFVRKEHDAQGDALVIADLKGPGVITRIATPTPTDETIEFYFDGETKPRVSCPYRKLFDGSTPPFLAPLSGYGSGGFYTYLPIPYKVSCKILARAPKVQFYQINYATYPADTALESFAPDSPAYTGTAMQQAQAALAMTGKELAALVAPPGAVLQTTRANVTLVPGTAATLFETDHGGRILGLRLTPASAFAGKERSLTLKITWDNAMMPAVLCPVGDFFGYSWGDPAARSLLVGSQEGVAYTYFPMPFDHSAKVEIVSEDPNAASVEVHAEIVHADVPRRADEGRFYALWRRENPTTKGKPFSYVQTEGRGQLVGVTLQAQGSVPGITPFFEGDDQATLDGELRIHGTGSEDFFNGGWYDVPGRWEARASYPLSGCLDYSRAQARSGGYRLFLTDAYRFASSIKLDMEHAPEKNDFDADYVGVSYLYLENPPAVPWTLPPLAARRVVNPTRLVFTPGWYMPIHAFSIENATLAKKVEHLNGADYRFLSLRPDGENKFGEHMLSLLCAVPASGRYRVSIDAMFGPAQGIAQLFENEHAIGPALDLYAEKRAKCPMTVMGEMNMKEGPNQVFFKLMGKNVKSSGMAFDVVTVALDKLP